MREQCTEKNLKILMIFAKFECGRIIKLKKHLTREGLDEIRKIKQGMNTGRSIGAVRTASRPLIK